MQDTPIFVSADAHMHYVAVHRVRMKDKLTKCVLSSFCLDFDPLNKINRSKSRSNDCLGRRLFPRTPEGEINGKYWRLSAISFYEIYTSPNMYVLSKRSQFVTCPFDELTERKQAKHLYRNRLLLPSADHEVILPEGWDHLPFGRWQRMPRQGDVRLCAGTR